MPDIPNFQAWPENTVPLNTPDLIHRAYAAGWRGCYPNPEAKERVAARLLSAYGYASVSDAAHANGWADVGAGKLVTPFIYAMKIWPGCFPGEAQQVGSCVSHGTTKAALITLACELAVGKPDPLTGKLEGAPDVPAASIKTGVLHPSPLYWSRGYSGDGWSCSEAAERIVDSVGLVIAQNYPELGVDLSHVTSKIEHLYGSRKPPEEWQTTFAQHKIHSSAEVGTFEEIRDVLFNGYGVSHCGGEGFSSNRNEDGVSRRSGSWSHCMSYIGADDRDTTKQKYGEPLLLVQNSWGPDWIDGPRRIMGTDIDIPEGSFWARWSDLKRRDAYAFSNVQGWPARTMPDWGSGVGLN